MIYNKLFKKTEIQPNIFELIYHQIHTGSCTCYKNCDCYEKKNTIIGKYSTYTHSLADNYINKQGIKIYKQYSTLKGVVDSYNIKLKIKLKTK